MIGRHTYFPQIVQFIFRKGTCKILSVFQVEETLLWTVCQELLPTSKNLIIQQKEVVLSINYMPRLVNACSYDDEWYFSVTNYISVENYVVNIKFLEPNGPAAQFFRTSLEDTCWIPIHDITKVDPPSHGSTGQFYCFDCDEMNFTKKLMWFIWHPFPVDSWEI